MSYVIGVSTDDDRANVTDDLVFWSVNLGIIGFASVLTLARADVFVFVPVTGAALLLAIVVHVGRLSGIGSGSRPWEPLRVGA